MSPLTAAHRHAPLLRSLIRREARQRYKASAFGLAWALVNPVIVVGAYWFVFRFVFPSGANAPYALFLFVGLTVWNMFMGGAQAAASSFVANASLVTKVKFPRQIVPLSVMCGNWLTPAAMLLIALPLCAFLGHGDRLTWVVIPLLVMLLAVFTTGAGLVLAPVNVYMRDTEHILSALAMPWFFLTPVLYNLPSVGGEHDWARFAIHYLNPVSPFVQGVRDPLFFGRWPDPGDVTYCVVAAGAMIGLGVAVFRRLEREMAVQL